MNSSRRLTVCQPLLVGLAPTLVVLLAILLAALLAVLLTAAPASAQCSADLTCQYLECRSPAFGVSSQLWGELEPVDTGQLPSNRDNTDFDEFSDPVSENQPHWMSLDIENGWIFAAINQGMQVWDARGGLASAPVRTKVVGPSGFTWWTPGATEEKNPVRDIDAPAGDDTMVAVAVVNQTGVNIFNTESKSQPISLYADRNKNAMAVYATFLGDNAYTFAATRGDGVPIYDMTAARDRPGPCIEDTPGQQICGVYVGRLGTRDDVSYVDGTGDFVAIASGPFGRGVEIFDVSDPTQPSLEIDDLTTTILYGVALWQDGSSYYLATRAVVSGGTQARIYDVSCLGTGSCNGVGSPIWTDSLPSGGSEFFVTFSRSGGRDFLYYGNVNRCSTLEQNEWLYDATTPSNPRDVTPPNGLVNGQTTGYWGWYYRRNPTGFNRVSGRVGQFAGSYFYRASFTLFDIHELTTGGPPMAAIAHDDPIYAGLPADFFDASSGGPTSWDWTFDNATPPMSPLRNPTGVTFASPGMHSVTLDVSNAFGSDSVEELIDVLDPAPAVAAVTVTPPDPVVCQTVAFEATGVTGLAPLSYGWEVEDSGGGTVATGSGNPFFWDTTGSPAGTYSATVTVSNGSGDAVESSPNVVLADPPPLAFDGPGESPETLNGPPFAGADVDFAIQTTGATEWRWDFGDGTPPVWVTDPTNGPMPSHSYGAEGNYDVTVDIQNCSSGPLTSNSTQVQITSVGPLVASFQAQGCAFGNCIFNAGEPITFIDETIGEPDFWDYDWDGDGSYEDAGHTSPVYEHVYDLDGTYEPVLRVRRGIGEDTDEHEEILIPSVLSFSVLIDGPSTVGVGDVATFSAEAVNGCDPPGSWSWDLADGEAVGGTTGDTVMVRFQIGGFRLVTASPGSGICLGLDGFKAVDVESDLIFGDGFESGNLSAWDLATQ